MQDGDSVANRNWAVSKHLEEEEAIGRDPAHSSEGRRSISPVPQTSRMGIASVDRLKEDTTSVAIFRGTRKSIRHCERTGQSASFAMYWLAE